jgi:hypothetical protein
MKKLIRIALALVVILIIVAGVIWYSIDTIAKTAIEKGGTYALGVETSVESVNIRVLTGSASIYGMQVANPQGYPSPHLMRNGKIAVDVDGGTLREDTVVITLVEQESLDLRLDKKDGRYNVEEITDHLKSLGEKDEGEPEPGDEPKPKEDKDKEFVVKKLIVRDVTVHIDGVPGSPFHVDEVVLENVGKDVSLDQLFAQVFPAVVGSVLKSLPGDAAKLVVGLTGELAGAAEALGGQAAALFEDSLGNVDEHLKAVTDTVGEATKGLGEATKGVGEGAEGAGDAIKKGLEGLLGGEKKEE